MIAWKKVYNDVLVQREYRPGGSGYKRAREEFEQTMEDVVGKLQRGELRREL